MTMAEPAVETSHWFTNDCPGVKVYIQQRDHVDECMCTDICILLNSTVKRNIEYIKKKFSRDRK